MTRDEAMSWLHAAFWTLVDMDYATSAREMEFTMLMVARTHVTAGMLHDEGERMRTRARCAAGALPPVSLRARLFAAAVLLSVEDA